AEQAAEGLRVYREWSDRKSRRNETASTPRFQVTTAESLGDVPEASAIVVDTVTMPVTAGGPAGRQVGRGGEESLPRADSADSIAGLATIWGRRHGANDEERRAACDAARTALEYVMGTVPAGATRHRELPVMVRLADGMLVEGRIDFAWTDGKSWGVVD